MKSKGIILVVIVAVCVIFFTTSGCAGIGDAQNNHIGDTFIATNGRDYKIIRRNNDLYIEKLDGSDAKRITLTPAIYESAQFSSNGKNIIYTESSPEKPIYVQDIKQAPYGKRRITSREYENMAQ
ncbi:MAG: hypothetical protein PHQ96_05155 [Candidatus Omnitrophica bacterium]|nr:hypothetical protein [Candidatus Omnitrophota bacterium]